MTVSEILEQAKALTAEEREALIDQLMAMQEPPKKGQPKTGAEIVATLEVMEEPIELVDPEIEDPVEWVKVQRRKRREKRKPYWNGEK